MVGTVSAQAVIIANWTFETSVPTTAGPHAAEVGVGLATGLHASGSTTYSNPVGNGSGESFSSNNWGIGDYYQFRVSTLGPLAGVQVSWDQTSSGTGPRDFQLQYSTNGFTYTNFGSVYAVGPASWTSVGSPNLASAYSADLSSIAALDNQVDVYVRLTNTTTVSANGGTVAGGGSNRVDNVIISATPVPEPFTMALAVAGLGLAARRRMRKA